MSSTLRQTSLHRISCDSLRGRSISCFTVCPPSSLWFRRESPRKDRSQVLDDSAELCPCDWAGVDLRLIWIELVGPCHRNTDRSQCVQNSNALSVLGRALGNL